MTAHFAPGEDPAAYDPLARRTLPAAWAERWAAAPEAKVLFEAGRGWVTAEELETATGRVAGRFAGAGLAPGDRVLFSTAPSIALVVAHVAAYRAGLVVVPANTAYTEREVAHVVRDAGIRAAVVDDVDRARWVRDASGDDVVVVGPEVDLPDAPAPVLDAVGSGRPGPPRVHVGDHRRPEGGRPEPREHAGQQ